MHKVYAFLLDFIPLVELVNEENRVLGDVLQRTALELLETDERIDVLRTLLDLSRDLGYMDPDIAAYLQKQLQRLRHEEI